MFRFLIGGLATVAGVVLLFVASFGNPDGSWRTLTGALPDVISVVAEPPHAPAPTVAQPSPPAQSQGFAGGRLQVSQAAKPVAAADAATPAAAGIREVPPPDNSLAESLHTQLTQASQALRDLHQQADEARNALDILQQKRAEEEARLARVRAEQEAAAQAEEARQAQAAREVEAARQQQAARDAETVRQQQAAREAEAARKQQAAREAEAAQKQQAARDAEAARQQQAASEAEAAQKQQAARDAEFARKQQAARDADVAQKQQVARDAEAARQQQAARTAAEAAQKQQVAREAEAARQQQAARDADVAQKQQVARDAEAARQQQAARTAAEAAQKQQVAREAEAARQQQAARDADAAQKQQATRQEQAARDAEAARKEQAAQKEQADFEARQAAASPAKPQPNDSDPDSIRGALARLRRSAQQPPPSAEATQPYAVGSVNRSSSGGPVDRGRARSSPGTRMSLAHDAILAGRIGDAQQLLEQAQLQLVFRPVAPTAGQPPGSSRAAGEVAEALSMLGAGRVDAALRALDRAMAQAGDGQGEQASLPPPPGNVRLQAPSYGAWNGNTFGPPDGTYR